MAKLAITKAEVLAGDTYFNRAHPHEPIFVLRANDPSAPFIVQQWIEFNKLTCDRDKLSQARAVATEMQRWYDEHYPSEHG